MSAEKRSSGTDMDKVRELMKDPAIQTIVAEAPPMPEDAIHLLRALGCPGFAPVIDDEVSELG